MYPVKSGSRIPAKLQPMFLLNLSLRPLITLKTEKRLAVVKIMQPISITCFYCNCVGAQTELIFDGGSIVMDATGKLIDEMPYF